MWNSNQKHLFTVGKKHSTHRRWRCHTKWITFHGNRNQNETYTQQWTHGIYYFGDVLLHALCVYSQVYYALLLAVCIEREVREKKTRYIYAYMNVYDDFGFLKSTWCDSSTHFPHFHILNRSVSLSLIPHKSFDCTEIVLMLHQKPFGFTNKKFISDKLMWDWEMSVSVSLCVCAYVLRYVNMRISNEQHSSIYISANIHEYSMHGRKNEFICTKWKLENCVSVWISKRLESPSHQSLQER